MNDLNYQYWDIPVSLLNVLLCTVEPVARNVGQCKLPGCTKRCFAGSEFCDKSHYDLYKSGGELSIQKCLVLQHQFQGI